MKKLVTLFFFLFIMFHGGFAQTYHPLIKTNKFWDVVYNFDNGFPCMCYCNGLRYFYAGDDTIVENVKYVRFKVSIMHSFYGSTGPFCPPYYADTASGITGLLVREDSISKKVIIRIGAYPASYEDILYDFSLEVGDTLVSYFTTCDIPLTVQSIEYLTLNNGDIVKKFIFDYYGEVYYIESIGCSQGLFEGLLISEWPPQLYCIEDQGVGLLSNDCPGWVAIDKKPSMKPVQVFPNPAKDFIHITGLKTSNITQIKIYNGFGCEVLRKNTSLNDEIIDISQMPNGCYLLMTGETGNSSSLKFIVRH